MGELHGQDRRFRGLARIDPGQFSLDPACDPVIRLRLSRAEPFVPPGGEPVAANSDRPLDDEGLGRFPVIRPRGQLLACPGAADVEPGRSPGRGLTSSPSTVLPSRRVTEAAAKRGAGEEVGPIRPQSAPTIQQAAMDDMSCPRAGLDAKMDSNRAHCTTMVWILEHSTEALCDTLPVSLGGSRVAEGCKGVTEVQLGARRRPHGLDG